MQDLEERFFTRLTVAQVVHDNEVRAAREEYFASLWERFTVLQKGLPETKSEPDASSLELTEDQARSILKAAVEADEPQREATLYPFPAVVAASEK